VNTVPIPLAVTLGDPTGIGPEVALRALAEVLSDEPSSHFVLVGDRGLVARLGGVPGLGADLPPYVSDAPGASRVRLADPASPLPDGLRPGNPAAANAAVAWLRFAGEGCLRGDFRGVVTGPVNKQAILEAGHRFVGQTEFLADLAATPRHAMMLLGHDDRGRWLRVVLATTHLPLRDVADALDAAKVRLAIELAAKACALLGLPRRRVGVCGLNPHAGEGGHLGREETDWIGPLVARMQAEGFNVLGPLAADTLFHQALHGACDAVVAMYHDQGLGPLKLVAFDNGVNWTLGLPFVRTSPDHGTAHDLVGTGRASASSMVAALRLARDVAARPARS
jgi:4-hydroxythreonine-4-phosphate dehydrogenase